MPREISGDIITENNYNKRNTAKWRNEMYITVPNYALPQKAICSIILMGWSALFQEKERILSVPSPDYSAIVFATQDKLLQSFCACTSPPITKAID